MQQLLWPAGKPQWSYKSYTSALHRYTNRKRNPKFTLDALETLSLQNLQRLAASTKCSSEAWKRHSASCHRAASGSSHDGYIDGYYMVLLNDIYFHDDSLVHHVSYSFLDSCERSGHFSPALEDSTFSHALMEELYEITSHRRWETSRAPALHL